MRSRRGRCTESAPEVQSAIPCSVAVEPFVAETGQSQAIAPHRFRAFARVQAENLKSHRQNRWEVARRCAGI